MKRWEVSPSMWLPREPLSRESTLEEFDQWVTPSLGRLQDSAKYRDALTSMQVVVEGVASVVAEDDATTSEALAAEMLSALREGDPSHAVNRLRAIVNLIFLTTAKSDNAVKCQYPIHHKRTFGPDYPAVRRGTVERVAPPPIVKAEDLIGLALRLRDISEVEALELLDRYVNFLLSSEQDRRQFRAIIEAYTSCDESEGVSGLDVLSPLVAFQVRGSVAATGGHDPEEIVRKFLLEWGLRPQIDFNTSDVTADDLHKWLASHDSEGTAAEAPAPRSTKSRAFDFVIPFRSPGPTSRIFVQSQFYAGDSGSVSHKNVDQAAGARARAQELFSGARFIELVDGAGYCASLRRDLQHLLFADNTHDFVQIRSIPIRLRRLLQESGVVSPLDVAVRVIEGCLSPDDLREELVRRHGSSSATWLELALNSGWISLDSSTGMLQVTEAKWERAHRYALLDEIVASRVQLGSDPPAGDYLLIPGFGPNVGSRRKDSWDSGVIDAFIEVGVVEAWSVP